MKHAFITLALAGQLAAGAAFAQTTAAATSETTGSGMNSGSYGSDWSSSLRMAMFNDDGASVRADSELASRWDSLSDDDKDMIRRDCAASERHSSSSTGGAGTTTGGASGATQSDAGGATSQSGGATSQSGGASAGALSTGASATNVSMEQMEQVCEATKDL